MLDVFICDDESRMLTDIGNAIKKMIPDCRITLFSSAICLLAALEPNSCDILLLDIDMPEISGLDVAKELVKMSQKPLLVFITSHDELVYDSLHYHPYGFIRKRYFNEEIAKMIPDCVNKIMESRRCFLFKCTEGNVRLLLSEILYFEGDGNYLRICTQDREYRMRDTMATVESMLLHHKFVRIHRGFLVNQAAITILRGDEAELCNGRIVPIGKNYAGMAKKLLMRYMIEE